MPIDLAPTHYFVINPAGSTADGSAILQNGPRKEIPWNRPLPQRLRIALNLGVLCCFLAAGLFIAWIRASHLADEAQLELRAEARALAAGMITALEQKDRVDVRGTLESMVHRRDFAAVAIHDASGRRLAAYAKSRDVLDQLASPPAPAWETGDFLAQQFPATLLLREPIRNQDAQSPHALLGTLVLYADLSLRWQGFYGEMAWICGALLLSLLLCAALVNIVQQRIVQPIYQLERTCRVIVEDRDYTLRAWKGSRDEIGTVIDCVNHLLDEVHRRGTALVEVRAQIAQVVASASAKTADSTRVGEETSALRTQFLSNMCHEIRTPLNRAGTLCRDLAAGTLTTEQRALVSAVHATGDLVIALLDDLLDYTRLESGKLEIQDIEFDPREVVETVIRMYNDRAHAKNLTLTYTHGAGVPTRVRADRARLRQVIGTLVGNSIKYAQAGEIKVSLGAQEFDASNATLQVDVLDSGFGIAEEARQRIHQALTENLQGQGHPSGSASLGISIANRLIQRMGGSLTISESADNRAGFSFTVPVAVTERSARPSGATDGETIPTPLSHKESKAAPSLVRTGRQKRATIGRKGEARRRTDRERIDPPATTEFAEQLMEIYLDSAPELFESLRRAVEQESLQEAQDAAHLFGTCSARVGANQVYELCRQIEDSARAGDTAMLKHHLGELHSAFERARASLIREAAARRDASNLPTHAISTTLQ